MESGLKIYAPMVASLVSNVRLSKCHHCWYKVHLPCEPASLPCNLYLNVYLFALPVLFQECNETVCANLEVLESHPSC